MEIEFLKNLPVPTYQPKPLSENDNPIDIPIISPFNETKNEFPFKTDYLKNKNVTTAIIDV